MYKLYDWVIIYHIDLSILFNQFEKKNLYMSGILIM